MSYSSIDVTWCIVNMYIAYAALWSKLHTLFFKNIIFLFANHVTSYITLSMWAIAKQATI